MNNQTSTNSSGQSHTKLTKLITLLFLLATYLTIYYLVFNYHYRLDFSSFYSACLAMAEHLHPYLVLETSYLPTIKKISANLNPPTTLLLFLPFSWLNYPLALTLWSGISLILGFIGAHLAFSYAFPKYFYIKYRFIIWCFFFSFYPVLVNAAIAQLSSLLLFFSMYGYHLFSKKNDFGASLCWGIIIAIKIFPALLLVFILGQRRYRVFFLTLAFLMLLCFLPISLYGIKLYWQYFHMMHQVQWFGDSWNASLFGYISRQLPATLPMFSAQILFSLGFITVFIWYALRMFRNYQNQLNCFCLTLCIMLLLSPLGWFYYFSLLALPLGYSWYIISAENSEVFMHKFLWLGSLFLLNFPLDYVRIFQMSSVVAKLTIYSFHFYGLTLLSYLLVNVDSSERTNSLTPNKSYFTQITISLFTFGWLVFSFSIIKHFL